MVKLCLVVALAACLTACTVVRKDGNEQIDQGLANIGISAAATIGCAQIPPASQIQARAALSQVETLAKGDLGAAYAALTQAAGQPGLAQLWHAIHAQLDARYEITPAEWTRAAQSSLLAAISGCRAGIASTRVPS